MSKGLQIIPYIMFEKNALEAAKFYTSVFPNSHLIEVNVYENDGEKVEEAKFTIADQIFYSIDSGPYWEMNASLSFMVNFDPMVMEKPELELRRVWDALSQNGKVLMPLQSYDYSPLYGWIEDEFGVSWQLILSDKKGDSRPFIMPAITFSKQDKGNALDTRNHYLQVFNNAKEGMLVYYERSDLLERQQDDDKQKSVMFSDLKMENTWFVLSDNLEEVPQPLNGGIAFMIVCETQEEIDYYWHHLSSQPEEENCGWLVDKVGISWQIVPKRFLEMVQSGSAHQMSHVMDCLMNAKKLVISEFENAYGKDDDGFIVVKEEIEASLHDAWHLWHDELNVKKWLGKNEDWHIKSFINDFRPGGKFEIILVLKESKEEKVYKGVYQKIEPFNQITLYLDDRRKVDVRFVHDHNEKVEIVVRIEEKNDTNSKYTRRQIEKVLKDFHSFVIK